MSNDASLVNRELTLKTIYQFNPDLKSWAVTVKMGVQVQAANNFPLQGAWSGLTHDSPMASGA